MRNGDSAMRKKLKNSFNIGRSAHLLLLPVQAFAEEYNIANGNITVTAGSGGQSVSQGSGPGVLQTTPTVITGTSDTKTVTITARPVILQNAKDVNIDRSTHLTRRALWRRRKCEYRA